jgi:hypothetical protein
MSVKKSKARTTKPAAKGPHAARRSPRDLSPSKSGASAVRGGLGIFKTTHDKREAGNENL